MGNPYFDVVDKSTITREFDEKGNVDKKLKFVVEFKTREWSKVLNEYIHKCEG
jgi:hypothetical protein